MVTIERAQVQDVHLFASLEQEKDTKLNIMPYTEAEHSQKFMDPDVVYLRILDATEVVGFMILALDPDSRSIEFRRIVVSIRERGIGQAAITEMEQFCLTDLRRQRIWLDVFEDNSRGLHIYEKLGYSRFGEREYHGRRLFLYEKVLRPD